MMVDYKDLPDNIQEYDREWAKKVLTITYPCALARTAPLWQGLSDDEREMLYDKAIEMPLANLWNDYAYLIEQALKEKNGKV